MKEKNTFEAHICDKCERAERTYAPCFTGFLTPEEAVGARRTAAEFPELFCLSFGGFAEAERVVLGFFSRSVYAEPTVCTVDDELYRAYAEQAELSYMHIIGSVFVSLDHRAVLGSLMALGLKREALGDIYVPDNAHEAYVVTLAAVAPFIADGLKTVGRDTVKVRFVSIDELPRVSQRFCNLSLTLASLRLDALISDALNLSRENAKKLVHSGRVSINHAECTATDKAFDEGDRVSVKGYGKLYIEAFQGKTQKDRFRVIVRKYL